MQTDVNLAMRLVSVLVHKHRQRSSECNQHVPLLPVALYDFVCCLLVVFSRFICMFCLCDRLIQYDMHNIIFTLLVYLSMGA